MSIEIIKKTGNDIFKVLGSKPSEEYIYKRGREYYQCSSNQVSEYIYSDMIKTDCLEDFREHHSTETNNGIVKPNMDKCLKLISQIIIPNAIEVSGIKYQPVEDCLVIDEEARTFFNSYRKSIFLTKAQAYNRDDAVSKGDFKDIYQLALNLCEKKEKSLNFFFNWLSWILKHPNDRLTNAIIFKGEQGTGKTLFFNGVWRKIIGKNYGIIGQSQLESDKNGYLMDKMFLYINEVSNNNGKYDISDKIKAFITDDYISIRRMYKETITYENPLHVVISSNHLVPVPIDNDDRRYSVFESQKLKNGNQIYNNLKSEPEQIENFLHFLLQRDVKRSDVDNPFDNTTKKQVQIHCENNLGLFYRDIIEDYSGMIKEVFGVGSEREKFLTMPFEEDTEIFFDRNDLYFIYRAWCSHNNIKSEFNKKKFTSLLTSRVYKFTFRKTTVNYINSRYLILEKNVLEGLRQ